MKGQNLAAVPQSPRRRVHSHTRLPDGRFVAIPVEDAMDEIAEKLRRIRAEPGPRAIGTYSGTMATNAGAANGAVTSAFLRAPGSRMSNIPVSVARALA